jgi:signal transduction histidine kinase
VGNLLSSSTAAANLTLPLAAALVGLAGSLAITIALYLAAGSSLDRAVEERLKAAGESAALFLDDPIRESRESPLLPLLRANELDGAFLVDRALTIVQDATGAPGRKANLLRVDPERVEAAFDAKAAVTPSYEIGDIPVTTGYFPIGGSDGTVRVVLVLEAGKAFLAARRELLRSLWAGVLLSLTAAAALGLLSHRWRKGEQAHVEALTEVARAKSMEQMAAMAAHEIRNPLGVIRGTVKLMRERSSGVLVPKDRAALDDILGEVERLHRLTEDFLELSAHRPLARCRVDVASLIEQAATAIENIRLRNRVGSVLRYRRYRARSTGDRRMTALVYRMVTGTSRIPDAPSRAGSPHAMK